MLGLWGLAERRMRELQSVTARSVAQNWVTDSLHACAVTCALKSYDRKQKHECRAGLSGRVGKVCCALCVKAVAGEDDIERRVEHQGRRGVAPDCTERAEQASAE